MSFAVLTRSGLLERSGKTAKYWENQFQHDHLFIAEEAVEVGLADEIIS